MGKRKLFNDPIYGLINFKSEFLYDLIDHKYFQRLRRIGQMGLTHYVYPGATHSRFQHAIGALYLMQSAVNVLREKGIEINEEESEAMCLAMLLHDIGHGPISHSLERIIVDVHHEDISLATMQLLNEEFDGRLDMAIQIFKGNYPRKFMHQLVSGQLDLDRMDYITRDSFYTGVAEGVIGYDRIISMINVVDNALVVEEKALFSIQKFLVAREIMYKQVYLHKTSISAEAMLRQFFKRIKFLFEKDENQMDQLVLSSGMKYFLKNNLKKLDKNQLTKFLELDDNDIYVLLKSSTGHQDFIISDLSTRLLGRKLFKTAVFGEVIASDFKSKIRQKVNESLKLGDEICDWYIIEGKESICTYSPDNEEIKFVRKDGEVYDLSHIFPKFNFLTLIDRHFLCYPT